MTEGEGEWGTAFSSGDEWLRGDEGRADVDNLRACIAEER